MSNNTFWGAVGGILVVWIGALIFVFTGPASARSEEEDKLTRTVRSLGQYAGLDANEIPSDDLVEIEGRAAAEWTRRVESMTKFFGDRDARYEKLGASSPGPFGAWLSDQWDSLTARYRESTGLAEDKALAFDRPTNPATAGDLARRQKEWNALEAFVDAVIASKGAVTRYAYEHDPKDAIPRKDFETHRITAEIDIPLAQLDEFLRGLLEDDSINFDISELAFGKRKTDLQKDAIAVVSWSDPTVTKESVLVEPPVIVAIELDILDWNPPAADEDRS